MIRKVAMILPVMFIFQLLACSERPVTPRVSISSFAIQVTVLYPGNSAEWIDDHITRLIEKEVGQIKEVDEINSESLHGSCKVTISFDLPMKEVDAKILITDAMERVQEYAAFLKICLLVPRLLV
ncbi:MAG: multidrug efflux pump subunit AcrB [Crocinitomicaceae bacterium]|jgi:multidrug efflux pump subunit AcrB